MCEGDLKCEESGTCVQELPLGGTNCLEPNFVCNEDNDCDDGTCVVNLDIGDTGCEQQFYRCEDDALSCVENVCTKVLPLGETDCTEPNTQCEDGLECYDDGTCVRRVPLGGTCGTDFSVCVEGAECCDNNTCMKVLDRGETGCQSDDYTKCSEGNTCVDDTCVVVVPFGSTDCSLSAHVCESETVCEGQTCVRRVPVGQSCSAPNVFCQSDLVCEEGVCKIPEDSSCNGEGVGEFCVDGTKCVGRTEPENKKCKTLVPPGETCERSVFQVCEEDLVCQSNVCKIKENDSCAEEGNDDQCESGTDCVGPDDAEECRKPIPVGQSCADEFSVCESQLVCEENVCKIPVDGRCDVDDFVCVAGSKCVRNGSASKCKEPIPVGEACRPNNGFDFCDDGLTCDRQKCRINENGDCLNNEIFCITSTTCVGDDTAKRCTQPVPLNEDCESVFLECEGNLICDPTTDTCKIDTFGRCDGEDVCKSGTRCVTIMDVSKCLPVLNPGDTCGNPLLGVCPLDYMCLRNKCENLSSLPKWYPCHFTNAKCAEGLVCAGAANSKYCVVPIPVGQPCKTNHAFLVCADGLTCQNGYCKA